MQNNKKIQLFYFDFSFWRIDICRIALTLGDIDYDYIRIPRKDWHNRKNSGEFLFGQLPTMNINHKKTAQTSAMIRYCGKLANLYPSDHFEAILVDQIIDVVNDITFAIGPSIREKNQNKKLEMRYKLNKKIIPQWLAYIQNYRKEYFESNFFVTKKFTIADIVMWRFFLWLNCGILDGISENLFDDYKNLKEYYSFINSYKLITNTKEYSLILKEISQRK